MSNRSILIHTSWQKTGWREIYERAHNHAFRHYGVVIYVYYLLRNGFNPTPQGNLRLLFDIPWFEGENVKRQ